MKKLHCPQCSVANLYVKNDKGERCLVFVDHDRKVISFKDDNSLEGFDAETIYCLGCSWSGSSKDLKKY